MVPTMPLAVVFGFSLDEECYGHLLEYRHRAIRVRPRYDVLGQYEQILSPHDGYTRRLSSSWSYRFYLLHWMSVWGHLLVCASITNQLTRIGQN